MNISFPIKLVAFLYEAGVLTVWYLLRVTGSKYRHAAFWSVIWPVIPFYVLIGLFFEMLDILTKRT